MKNRFQNFPILMITDGGTSGGGGGGTVGAPGGSGVSLKGNAHAMASRFVDTYQHRLEMELARISQLAKVDPAAAQRELAAAWSDFLDGAAGFIEAQSGPFQMQAKTVVQQALSTRDLTATVDALWNETGGQDGIAGLNSEVASKQGSGGGWGKLAKIFTGIIALGTSVKVATGGGSPPPPAGTPPPPGGTPPPPPAGGKTFEERLKEYLELAGKAGQSAGTILSLVPKPEESRQFAAGLQQNIQDAATEIERRVNSGEMDPESGLIALTSLQSRITELAKNANPDYQRAAAIAGIVVGNVMGNVTNKRTGNINAKLGAPGPGAAGPGAGGLLAGTVGQQREQFGTAVRQRLATGTAGTAGPEIDRLLAPMKTPNEMMPGALETVNKVAPGVIDDAFGDKIKLKLQDFLQRPQVY